MFDIFSKRGRRGGSGFLLVIYLLFGLYFINYAFNFIKLPAAIDPINKWIIFVGGALIIWGGFSILRLNRYKNY